MLFREGSFVDCTIEDTKLKGEEKEDGKKSSYLYTQAVHCPLMQLNVSVLV